MRSSANDAGSQPPPSTRRPLSTIDGSAVDVAIIGGGINGAAAAQALAASGYSVMLLERHDFGAGASSRSSRLVHCGLRYFATGQGVADLAARPGLILDALRGARRSMQVRGELAQTMAERIQPLTMLFPVFADDPYAPWQIRAALGLLARFGSRETPLRHRWIGPNAAGRLPFMQWAQRRGSLKGVATYTEYQIDWPERVVIDLALDAERMGAVVRNYTEVTALNSSDGRWALTLEDRLSGECCTVLAAVALNLTGVWIDEVNARTGRPAGQKVKGTKGSHIVLKLPEACAGHAISTVTSRGQPFYCMPWRGLHFFGPTDSPYDGDPDEVAATGAEVDELLHEANRLLPGLNIRRDQIVSTWAGVRPLTFDARTNTGRHLRRIHDMVKDGSPGLFALTNGSVSSHRDSAIQLCRCVSRRFAPSLRPQTPSLGPRGFPEMQNSSPLLDDDAVIKLADLVHSARSEHVVTLDDLLSRRTGVVWSAGQAIAEAATAAAAVTATLGWDEQRAAAEAQSYVERTRRLFGVPG